MQLLLILAIVAALVANERAPATPVAHGGLGLAVAACGTVFLSVCALAASHATVRAFERDFARRQEWLRRFRRVRAVYTAAWLVATGILFFALDWGPLVRCNWQLQDALLVDDLLILVPVVLPLLVAWAASCQVEQAARQRKPTTCGPVAHLRRCGRYLGLLAKCHLLLILAPLLGLLALADGLRLAAPGLAGGAQAGLVLLPALVVLSVCFPLLIKHAWRAGPLPPGSLRAALQADSRRWRAEARDVLLWPTGNQVVAVAVTGLIPALRYIVLSDALVGRLADDEIRVAVAHEAGHLRHRHLWLRVMAVIAPLVLLLVAGRVIWEAGAWWFTTWSGPAPAAAGLPVLLMLPAIGGYALLVFGPYCRLLEHEADLFACRGLCGNGATSVGPDTPMTSVGTARFVAALEHLCAEAGADRRAPTWLHPSTAQRTRFLHALLDQPQRQRRFLRMMRSLERLVVGTFVVSLVCLWVLL